MANATPPVGPTDASLVPRYAGIATFARLPRLEDVPRADIAIVGVPFDSGVSYRPGARFGPAHVREASRLLRPYNAVQDVEPFARQQVADAGDIAANPFDITEAVAQIQAAAAALSADGKRLITIGGDHTIALPLLRVVAERHGPVAVLHFDAHLDTWDTYFGAPITHGTPFRRASEEGLIDMEASLHVDEAFLRGAAERGAVRNRGTEVRVPSIEVCVEVKHRDRPVAFGNDAKQREGDCVVATDRDQPLTVGGQCGGGRLDLRDGFGDVERVRGDVASVGDLLSGERLDILYSVVRAEQPGSLAHVGGTKARAGAVADAAVEGDADDRDVRARDVLEAWKTGEGRDTGVAGNQARVGGADRRRGVGHGLPVLEREDDLNSSMQRKVFDRQLHWT